MEENRKHLSAGTVALIALSLTFPVVTVTVLLWSGLYYVGKCLCLTFQSLYARFPEAQAIPLAPRQVEQPQEQFPVIPAEPTRKQKAEKAKAEFEDEISVSQLFPDEATRKAAEGQAQAKLRKKLNDLMR